MNLDRQKITMTILVLISLGCIGYVVREQSRRSIPATQTIQTVSSSGAPVSVEVKPLDQVGAMAADSLRTRINEINAGYLQLQETERKALDLNTEWNLDLPGNRMIHQAPQPASAQAPAAKK